MFLLQSEAVQWQGGQTAMRQGPPSVCGQWVPEAAPCFELPTKETRVTLQ